MDDFDSQRFSSVYRSLAEILERDRDDDRAENHLSYVLGDLTRRIFVGARYLPPDELLEEVAGLLRSGNRDQSLRLAQRLRDHAQHLDDLGADSVDESDE